MRHGTIGRKSGNLGGRTMDGNRWNRVESWGETWQKREEQVKTGRGTMDGNLGEPGGTLGQKREEQVET